jgi:hypothetical protein
MKTIPFKDDSTTKRRLDFSQHPLKTEERVKRFCEVFYKGKAFVSHTAADTEWCEKHILPHLGGFDDYFFLSWRSPPELLNLHQALVIFAFRSIKTVVVVISVDALASKGRLLDHDVGEREQRRRNDDANRSRCRKVDDQIELGRLLDRDVTRLRPA